MKRTSMLCVSGVIALTLVTAAFAQYTSAPQVRLAQDQPAATSNGAAPKAAPEARTESRQEVVTETETTTVESEEQNWDIVGPIRLRSADPEELGEIELKAITHYGTSSDGSDDDVELEGELEWGFAPNHELFFSTPLELGDGGVDGNADLSIGWHWRLWKEDMCGWLPAFAIRNILRVPSGYESSGVDWTFKGLITKSIIPNKFRFHINPYLKSVNGNNLESEEEDQTSPIFRSLGFGEEEGHRYFQWGVLTGVDYKLTDKLDLIVDYIHEASEMEGDRNQHIAEIGLDWELSKHQTIGIANRIGLDGDSVGENWGFSVSYIIALDAPAIGKHTSACE